MSSTLLRAPTSPEQLLDLHREYRASRDPQVQEVLVRQYEGLARSIAVRLSRDAEDRDDVVQVALIGLVKALDRFDPSLGFRFSTFAWATIRGELKRYHRDEGWALHVPRRLQEVFLRVAAGIEELTHELGRSPTIPEIAEHTGDTDEDVIEAIEVRSAWRTLSLDAPAPGGREDTIQLADEESGLADVEQRAVLTPLLARLAHRDRRIVELRFVHDMTQSEIATRVGLSQMQVSRVIAGSIRRMREWAAEDAAAAPTASAPFDTP